MRVAGPEALSRNVRSSRALRLAARIPRSGFHRTRFFPKREAPRRKAVEKTRLYGETNVKRAKEGEKRYPRLGRRSYAAAAARAAAVQEPCSTSAGGDAVLFPARWRDRRHVPWRIDQWSMVPSTYCSGWSLCPLAGLAPVALAHVRPGLLPGLRASSQSNPGLPSPQRAHHQDHPPIHNPRTSRPMRSCPPEPTGRIWVLGGF